MEFLLPLTKQLNEINAKPQGTKDLGTQLFDSIHTSQIKLQL
jgi:hypothetical protein